MLKKFSLASTRFTVILLLVCFIGCNANIPEISKSVATDSSVRKSVAKSIQQQLEILENYPDEDILDLLDAKDTTGEEAVTKALGEKGGVDYLDFCYAANQTGMTQDTSYMMKKAEHLMNKDKYGELKSKIEENEKSLSKWGQTASKDIAPDKQEAFYSDLKKLIVKTSVMLIAAFVYAAIPNTVVWGKIPAAAALAIGAGVAAGTVLDVYGYFAYGFSPDLLKDGTTDTDMSFQDWVNKLKDSSTATYAIATAATSYMATLGLGKIPTAITLCVFAVYNATTAIAEMQKTYGDK